MQLVSVNKTEYDIDKEPLHTYQWKAYTFNGRGAVLDETEYDREGKIVRKNIFRNNDKGSLFEVLEYHSSDELMERIEYEEDEDGLLTRIITTYSDGSKLIKTFRYTDLGEAEELIITDENDEYAGREVHSVNDDLLTAIEFDADNNETHRLEQRYFSEDKIAEERKYYQHVMLYEKLFHYNDKGQLEKTESRNLNEVIVEAEFFTYDQKGTLREHTRDTTKGTGGVFERFTFNTHGHLDVAQTYRGEMMVFQNICEYDSDHRLISEEVFDIDWNGIILAHEKLEHIYNA